jgi:hypothetical protein
MGRFRYHEEDDGANDGEEDQFRTEQSRTIGSSKSWRSNPEWEFVAQGVSEQGALVSRGIDQRTARVESTSNSANMENNPFGPSESNHNPLFSNTRPTFIVLQQSQSIAEGDGSEWCDDYSNNQDPTLWRRTYPGSVWIPTWVRTILLAMVVQLALFGSSRYGPPAPPLPNTIADDSTITDTEPTTWNDYVSLHGFQLWQSTRALFFDTPLHLAGWGWMHIHTELRDLYQDYRGTSRWNSRPRPCSLRISSDINLWKAFESSMVGQPLAVQILTERVQTWNRDSPLLFFATGGIGEGKQTALIHLARHVLMPHCFNAVEHSSEAQSEAVLLLLDGQDFLVDHEALRETLQAKLATRILRHVKKLQEGSIILLKNVEHMEPSLLSWLLHELGETGYNDLQTSTWQLRKHCRQSVIMFTSTEIGRMAITQSIRTHGTSEIYSQASLVLDVGHELMRHLGGRALEWPAIVPFFPLTQKDLSAILDARVRHHSTTYADTQWRTFSLTSSLKTALLEPSSQVEYIAWRGRQGSDPDATLMSFTFSSTGAQVLGEGGPVWIKIQAQLNRCVFSRPLKKRSDQDVVMDYDARIQRGMVQQCEYDGACTELCRFPIHTPSLSTYGFGN